MQTVIPSVRIITCDICGKEIKGRFIKAFYDVKVTKVIFSGWGKLGFERIELDLCNDCRKKISNFIQNEIEKERQKLISPTDYEGSSDNE